MVLKVGQAKELIRSMIREGVNAPVMLFGAPGIGKSDIMKQLAEEEFGSKERWPDGNYLNVELSTREAPDIQGIPMVDGDGEVQWTQLVEFPESGEGIINFDEINLAEMQTMKASYRWIHERKVGKRELPEDWFIVATGNRQEDRSNVNTLPAALNNRFTIYEVESGLDDWKNWAYNAGIHPDVIGFLNWKSDALFKFDPEKYSPEDPYPTPRSWERVSDKLEAGIDGFDALTGDIGEGMAGEFREYRDVKGQLPDIEKILEGKDVVPDRPDLKYVICSSLVARASDKPEHADRLVEYSLNLSAEFGVMLVKDAKRAGIPVRKADSLTDFTDRFGDYIL